MAELGVVRINLVENYYKLGDVNPELENTRINLGEAHRDYNDNHNSRKISNEVIQTSLNFITICINVVITSPNYKTSSVEFIRTSPNFVIHTHQVYNDIAQVYMNYPSSRLMSTKFIQHSTILP